MLDTDYNGMRVGGGNRKSEHEILENNYGTLVTILKQGGEKERKNER
jgi:hypothetical protein